MSDRETFARAVENDEYAELELSTGDVLITDWEGDGLFNPYVVPKDDDGERGGEIADAIADALSVPVRHIHAERDTKGDLIYYPSMPRPEL